jgi:hypothetical protein
MGPGGGAAAAAVTGSPRAGRAPSALYRDYYRFQCDAIRRHLHELASFARGYARSQGREVLVSGKFFNMDPQYLALSDDVDVMVTEMRNATHRQPEWYRYVAGFGDEKDVIVVENRTAAWFPSSSPCCPRARTAGR